MLTATNKSWSEQAVQRLRKLADRPVLLVLVLLAANAVAHPYAGIEHDARLYSVQVLNQVEGNFSNDLFFRYGSQDQYSVFSRMMVPLVKVLDLKLAFFLVYLASNALFIVGLVRLVTRLLDDGLLRLASLVYLVVAPLNYGGLYTFHVEEQFLTPRLPAAGLVLLGLAELVPALNRKRSLLFMVLAGMLHPLIAVSGVLVWGGVLLVDKLGWRGASIVAGALTIAGAAFLSVPSVASQVLGGTMDDVWRDTVLVPSTFNFATEWEIRDWANVIFGFVGVVAGVLLFRMDNEKNSDHGEPAHDGEPSRVSGRVLGTAETRPLTRLGSPYLATARIRLVAVVGLVGLAGVVGTFLAEKLQYALLLQGQPYRALWILKVFQVPLLFLLTNWLFRAEETSYRLLAIIPLYFLLSNDVTSRTLTVCFVPGTALFVRGLGTVPRRPDWLVYVLPWAMVQGELAGCIYHAVVFLSDWNAWLNYHDFVVLIHIVIQGVSIVPWMIILFASMVWLFRRGVTRRALSLVVGIFLAVQTAFFVLPNTSFVRARSADLPDMLFARDFLRTQPAQAKTPTIYANFGRVDHIWLELEANSYFDWWQLSGIIFRRQTAMEGQRRALVVGPFEVQRSSRQIKDNVRIQQFFQAGPDSPLPTVADLKRLCADPEVDYAILLQDFPGFYAPEATNGRVYVYDCQKIRAMLHLSDPTSHVSLDDRSREVPKLPWKEKSP